MDAKIISISFLEGLIKSKISSRNHYIDTGKLKKAFKLNDEINHLWQARKILNKIP